MKKITKLDVIALAVGSIIGWGAFTLPGEFFLSEIGLLNSILGLLIGLVIILIIEKNYTYLISKFNKNEGEIIYIDMLDL